jgi:membrane dipeptidase
LIGRATIIDMLSPLTLDFTKQAQWFANPESFLAADLQPFKDSKINVFHTAIGMGGPEAHVETLKFFGAWNGFIANHDEHFMRIDSASDLDRVKRSGKVGILLGLQNSDHFRRPDDVDLFRAMGQRVSQLTYNSRNLIGNGATERRDEGISDFGVAIIQRMNKVGMAVDVSHCGDRTTLDAFELSKTPVLITHSNCRALVGDHPRCKSDEAIKKVGAAGSVMGITGVRMFVKIDEPTTIEHVLDHFDHVRKLTGPEHLGVGSDIDLYGYDSMPPELNKQLRAGYKGSYAFREKIDVEGLNHPKRMFDLTEGLIRRKYSDRDIEGILGGNFKRVLSQIWNV